MDKRNEYRVRQSVSGRWFYAEFRAPRLWGWGGWLDIFGCYDSAEDAEAACRRHAGEGTKYLGRLP